MDIILKAYEDGGMANTKDMVVNCLDAVTLIGYDTSELNNKRKQNVKSQL